MKKLLIIPEFLESYRAKKLRVGFSGGADSTALLLLLLKWGFTADQLEAVHFDHGLRGEASTADGLWCKDFCAKCNIKFILVKLDLSQAVAGGGSLEDAARNARLQWYKSNDDQSPIALAHHAGDVAENMLLKLARGSNVSALTSLKPVRKLWNLTLLRPLLEWQKSDLEAFLREENISSWRHDATNSESIYHRNFLRNEILSKWAAHHPPLAGGIANSARVLAMDADFIEQAAAGKLAELGNPLPERVAAAYWQNMHAALLGRVLRSYLSKMSHQSDLVLTLQNIEQFKQALNLPLSNEKRIIELNKDFHFQLTAGTLQLILPSTDSVPDSPQSWNWRTEPQIRYGSWKLECRILPGAVTKACRGVFYFNADSMPETLTLALRQGGETMQVWGSAAPRRIKHLLAATGSKENMLLVTDDKQQIYLLGDLRRSIHAPVTGKTLNTLEISVFRDTKK